MAAWSSARFDSFSSRGSAKQRDAAAAATQVGFDFFLEGTGPSRNCARRRRVLKVHMHLGVCLVDQLDRVQGAVAGVAAGRLSGMFECESLGEEWEMRMNVQRTSFIAQRPTAQPQQKRPGSQPFTKSALRIPNSAHSGGSYSKSFHFIGGGRVRCEDDFAVLEDALEPLDSLTTTATLLVCRSRRLQCREPRPLESVISVARASI